MLSKITKAILIPALIMNALAGVVGFVWMLCSGEWSALGVGAIYAIFSPMILGLALTPGMLFAGPLLLLTRRTMLVGRITNIVGFLLCMMTQMFTAVLMTATIVAVLVLMPRYTESVSRVAVLLWAYGVALWPWQYMESEEKKMEEPGDSKNTTLFVILASLGTTAAVIVSYLNPMSVWGYSCVIGGVMLFAVLLTSVLGYGNLRQRRWFV